MKRDSTRMAQRHDQPLKYGGTRRRTMLLFVEGAFTASLAKGVRFGVSFTADRGCGSAVPIERQG